MSATDALAELENQVSDRFLEKVTERLPLTPFDPTAWLTGIEFGPVIDGPACGPIIEGHPSSSVDPRHQLQFPREQWVVYPNRRAIALSIVARALELETITDDQWAQIAFLMAYGGKERIA